MVINLQSSVCPGITPPCVRDLGAPSVWDPVPPLRLTYLDQKTDNRTHLLFHAAGPRPLPHGIAHAPTGRTLQAEDGDVDVPVVAGRLTFTSL